MEQRGVYVNADTTFRYRYARPYGLIFRDKGNADDDNDDNDDDAADDDSLRVVAVPEGIYLDANAAALERPRFARIFVYVNVSLSERELITLDEKIGSDRYILCPIRHPERAIARLDNYPRNNFYMNFDDTGFFSSASRLVEYRYFLDRHRPATVIRETATGRVFRLAPPPFPTMIVLIMPENFVQTDARKGYFVSGGGGGIIVNVYARRLLSCAQRDDAQSRQINVLSSAANETRLLSHARSLLARLGMHRVETNRDADGDLVQIYARDEYATLIIGRVDNLSNR